MFSKIKSIDHYYIVAFSGGPDSVFLVEKLIDNNFNNLILAHFNHRISVRDGENYADENFVKKYAKSKNLKIEIGVWDNPKKSESKARDARYKFLYTVKNNYNAEFILTAHHKDDQAETIFLQFMRSGGIKSLSGMKEIDKKTFLYRPLLNITKSEILLFLNTNKIEYCTDSSNFTDVFTRNFIRNSIFPSLETRFPNLVDHLVSEGRHFRILEEDIENLANKFLEVNFYKINLDDFDILIVEVKVAVIRKILVNKELSKKFIKSFLEFIKNRRSGSKLNIKSQEFSIYGNYLFVKSNIN
jgi:tRNA(Ile)-lysidine synthase